MRQYYCCMAYRRGTEFQQTLENKLIKILELMPENNESQSKVLGTGALAVATILGIILVLLGLSLTLQGNLLLILSNPVGWFNTLVDEVAFDILSTSAELLAAVLAIAITVVAIVVELAANRYSHRITSLFVREPINIFVMTFLVIATLHSLWIALTLNTVANAAGDVPSAGLLISMLMMTLSLVILLPYFAFVMEFLSPVNIISKIETSASKAVSGTKSQGVPRSKLLFLNAIDDLQDITRRSIELSDRAVEMASINALFNLTLKYQEKVNAMASAQPEWFEVDTTIHSDLDFVSINSGSLNQIELNRIWVEVKILRQYLDIVSDSSPSSRDTTYLIAMNTRKIAVSSIKQRPNLELIDLCIRCFNSYLRATINNSDPRTGYYIMNQYRMLAEDLMREGKYTPVKEIALHLQFYGTLGFKLQIPFLLEVAAEDVASLAAGCPKTEPELLDRLMDLLLDLDQEIKAEYQEDSLLGVRRAQLKLAAELLRVGDETRANRICQDIATERKERIEQLIDTLEQETRSEYWEFTDRGINFSYIEPELKAQLAALRQRIRPTDN